MLLPEVELLALVSVSAQPFFALHFGASGPNWIQYYFLWLSAAWEGGGAVVETTPMPQDVHAI